jgi:hypothetical protein
MRLVIEVERAHCGLMNEQSNISAVGLDEAEGRTYLKRAARRRVVADELKSDGARTLCLQLAESYEKSAGVSCGQPSDTLPVGQPEI